MATASINRMHSKTLSPLTKGDLVDASKAIYDELNVRQENRLKELETEVTLRLGKSLDSRVSDNLDGVLREQTKALMINHDRKVLEISQAYEQKAIDLGEFYESKSVELRNEFARSSDQMRKSFEARLGTVERSQEKSLDMVRKSYEERIAGLQGVFEKKLGDQAEQLGLLNRSYEDRVAFLAKAHQEGMDRIADLLEKLHIPAPLVTVNVPEQVVNLTSPEVVVNVPEQQPPTVNVEAASAVPMRKTFEYDAHGRPVVVNEYPMEKSK